VSHEAAISSIARQRGGPVVVAGGEHRPSAQHLSHGRNLRNASALRGRFTAAKSSP